MVTQKQQIARLREQLKRKQLAIDNLIEEKKLTREREKLIRDLRKVRNPRAFLRRESTKKTLKRVGGLSWKGAKKTWDFLGKMAEEDQRKLRKRTRKRK